MTDGYGLDSSVEYSLAHGDRSSLSEIGERAQRALRERPRFTIRARLGLGFVVWLVLSLVVTVVSVNLISRIEQKLYFTKAANDYAFEIQQARRFEKNFFLYGTNLDDALERVRNAERILDSERYNIESVVGASNLEAMIHQSNQYEQMLVLLRGLENVPGDQAQAVYAGVERELRRHGSEMVGVAEDLIARERRAVNSMLLMSERVPLAFLALLGLLIVFLAIFISRQMLAPLSRMVHDADRMASGDFTPIRPRRRYYDEFSELALSMNHMMLELVHRHDLLVQAHKLKAVGTLTAGVAHELNNPINNIMLTASMLLEDREELSEAEQLEMVTDLVNESERAQKIVRNLLDFARESSAESEAIRAEDVIEETLQLAGNQINLAKVKVAGRIDDGLPSVYGDRQQLTQVFLNMVLNALDSMPDGGVLSISVSGTQSREFVAVEFTDTGIGIAEQELESIFDPFYTTKPNARGTGLGLSVSLGIIKRHGGDIQVRSRVGEGTTFTVLLPVAKVPAVVTDERQLENV